MYQPYDYFNELKDSMSKPKVDSNKCVEGCFDCLDVCPAEAIIISKKTHKAFILNKKCINCGGCIEVCYLKAIRRRK